MRRASSLRSFVSDPVGTWIAGGPCVVWSASPSLAGATVWGTPDVDDSRAILERFDAFWASTMGTRVDIVLDASRVERIDPRSLAMLVEWLVARRPRIALRVRQQVGVVDRGIVGITLAGILPVIGETHPFRIAHDPRDAFRMLVTEDPDALHREIEAIVREVMGVPTIITELRALLRARLASVSLHEAARALNTSSRSLQRVLGANHTSFQLEVRDARFAAAQELVTATNEKIAAIAHRVGITEGALSQLFRERTGTTPAEFRRQRDERSCQ